MLQMCIGVLAGCTLLQCSCNVLHACRGGGPNPGFNLFTDSEVRHVRCDYVMHYSSVCKRGKVGVSETQKSKVRAKFM